MAQPRLWRSTGRVSKQAQAAKQAMATVKRSLAMQLSFQPEHVVATTGSALRFCGRLASKKKRCESQSGMSGGLIGTRCSTSSTKPPSWMAP